MTATQENQAQGSAVTTTPLVSVIIPAFRNPAFLNQALALKTTADVTTVDGGNIAAALR